MALLYSLAAALAVLPATAGGETAGGGSGGNGVPAAAENVGRGAPNLVGAGALPAAEGKDELTDRLDLLLDFAASPSSPSLSAATENLVRKRLTILVGC